jgi:L-aminopeptidase/D-esterase-like protein
MRPGPRNLITDVAGITVGHAQDIKARTGATVVLPDDRAVAAVDVRGGGPGTRETDALAADTLVEAADAIVLAGGSVYGLAAADAVTAWLGARGRGFHLAPGAPPAPIVPAAILFDLANGGDKRWGLTPPYHALGLAAVKAADLEFALGSVGAGSGAMAGRLKGGVGSASIEAEDFTVGALAAVNSFGSVVRPGGRAFWAAPFEIDNEFGGLDEAPARAAPDEWGHAKREARARESTTLGVVATDADLTPAELRRLAVMAQDGFARAIRPVHTPFDGDVVFTLATARRPLPAPRPVSLTRLGALAADCLARAVARGVFEAVDWPDPGGRAWRDLP